MNELIPIRDNNGKKAVNARELHVFLESKQEFANWIKNRIEKYGLIENYDFLIILSKTPNGRPLTEYALTIDAAKELSMVEGNAKGKQARQYFIECEKRANQGLKSMTPAEMLLHQAQAMVAHERQIAELKEKTETIEGKLDGLLQLQAATTAELKSIPVSTDALPEMGLRDKIRLMINRYAQSCGVAQQTVWDNVYQTLYYTYHVHIKSYAKHRKDESWLDVAERNGHMDKLYIIASNLLRQKGLLNF